MADNTIDTLDIQVESSTAKAVQSINNLIKRLGTLDKSLSGINTGGLRNYSKELGRVAVAFNSIGNINTSKLDKAISKINALSKVDLSNLKNQKIDIDLDIKGGDQTQKLQYAIDKTIRDIKVDTSALSSQIIKSFDLKGGAAAKIRAQMTELSKEMAQSYDGTEVSAKLNEIMTTIGNTIIQSGSVVKSNLGDYLKGADQEWVDFYNEFKNKKIYVSDMLKADIGKSEFSSLLQENLKYIVRDATKGITIDWDELTDKYPTLFSKDIANQADQIISFLEKIKLARDNIKPVSIQSLMGSDATKASDEAWGVSTDAYNQLAKKIKERIQSTLQSTNGELPVDIKINTDKITLDIQKAINKAAELKYNTVKVTLDVDTEQIKDAVSGKLKELDADQMTSIADSMKNFSVSLKDLGNVNFKGSGLNMIINSINRLGQADLSNFSNGTLGEIINELSTKLPELANIPDVSNSINRVISSLARLASSGQNIQKVGPELSNIANELKSAIEKINSVGTVSESINQLVASFSRLATAGNKMAQTTTQLPALTKETTNFFNAMKNAPEISNSTIRMTEALSQLANAGSRVGRASSTTSSALSGMQSQSSKTVQAISAMGNAFSRFSQKVLSLSGRVVRSIANIGKSALSAEQNLSKLSSPINKIATGLSNIYAKGFLASRALSALSTPVKSAMDYVETLNYFNSAFKQVAENIDTSEWKKSGVKSAEEYANSFQARAKQLSQKLTGFNISDTGEMTRTNTASLGLDPEKTMQYQATFAQMASSMGDTSETALKLSDALTMIGADLASVRNMDFEDVWQDMSSGLTGMSRALDKYGVNIRNANMQQELARLGINANVSSMTQADKTILRTIILLNSSKYAWADLSDTLNQPANQIRMLQSNFASLGRTIGSLFIPILQTVLPYINAIVIALQRMFAYIAKLLGIKLSNFVSSTGGISVDTGDIADNMDNASGAIDNANKNAKKLEKTLSVMSFDELNQLNDNSDSSSSSTPSSGSGTGGLGHIGALDAALDDALSAYQKAWEDAFNKMSNRANEMADAIVNAFKKKDWKGLGKIMADGINWGMKKLYDALNWNKVGPYITKFTSAFTQTFNSLVGKGGVDFDLIGRTVGAGITTLVKTFNLLTDPSTGINFKGIGSGISTSLRGMINEIPWTELGNALGNKFMISWRILDGFVQDMSKKNDAGITGWQQLGTAVANTMNGISEKINFSEIASALTTGINGAFDSLAQFTKDFEWDDLVDNITGGITTFIEKFDWQENGQKLETFLDNLLESLVKIAKDIPWEEFGKNVGIFLSQISWGEHLSQLGKVLLEVLGGIWSGLGETSAGTFVQAIVTFGIVEKLLPVINTIGAVFGADALVGSISANATAAISNGFSNVISLFGEGGAIYEALSTGALNLGYAFEGLTGIALPVEASFGIIVAAIVAFVASVKNAWDTSETFRSTVIGAFAKVKDSLVGAFNKIKDALSPMIDSVKNLASTFVDLYNNSPIKPVVVLFESLAASIVGTALSTAIDAVSTAFSGIVKVFQGGIDLISGVFEILKGIFTLDFSTVAQGFKDVGSAIVTAFSGIGTVFLGVGKDIISGLYNGIKDSISTIGSWLKEHVFNPIVDNFKNLFGIHSPSTVFAEFGRFLMEGLMEGINKLKDKVAGIFTGISDKIKSVWDWVTGHTSDKAKDMSNDVGKSTSQMKEDVNADFSEIEKQTDTYMRGVSNTTSTNWGNSSREATLKAREMKNAVSKELGYMDKSVTSHFQSQYNIAYKKWQNIGRDISSYISKTMCGNIEGALKSVVRTIRNSFSDMYSIGQNAMSRLANGMYSVHIATPHIYMNSSANVNGNSASYRWDSGINWYAKGGLFNNASVIGVGEAGNEAVLPLENRKVMKGIADSIMSGYDGSMGLTKDELAAAVERGVVTALMNNGGIGGSAPEYIMNSIKVNERELARIVTKAQNNTDYRMNPSPAY